MSFKGSAAIWSEDEEEGEVTSSNESDNSNDDPLEIREKEDDEDEKEGWSTRSSASWTGIFLSASTLTMEIFSRWSISAQGLFFKLPVCPFVVWSNIYTPELFPDSQSRMQTFFV